MEQRKNEEKSVIRSCIDCGKLNCEDERGEFPDFCPTTHLSEEIKEKVTARYFEPDNHQAMVESAIVESEHYCEMTRVEETIQFAKQMQAKKIGIATCVGLIRESRVLARILREHGFEVYGIGCKVGTMKKVDMGIPVSCEKTGRNICNPVLQAELLNQAHTDLNIVVGLCVGHDSLFYKYSQALTTTLIVKDRVLGHNPVAALYQADGYYKSKL
jgi:uncharacterized metal-binding protein